MQLEGGRGTTVSIPLTLSAEAGIKSLSVTNYDGIVAELGVTAGETQLTYTHEFVIPAEATIGHRLQPYLLAS